MKYKFVRLKGSEASRKKLKKKNELKEQELEKKRNEARLKYPLEFRIYLSTKNE